MNSIVELLNDLRAAAEKANPDGMRRVLPAPRTREDAEHAIAEQRAEDRRWAS